MKNNSTTLDQSQKEGLGYFTEYGAEFLFLSFVLILFLCVFITLFRKFKIIPIPGDTFNPDTMENIDNSNVNDCVVLDVIEQGFRQNKKVRKSRVVVCSSDYFLLSQMEAPLAQKIVADFQKWVSCHRSEWICSMGFLNSEEFLDWFSKDEIHAFISEFFILSLI